jgi:hypothetical protein
MQRKKLNAYLMLYTKINSKCTRDLNIRPETTKTTRKKNIGKKLFDIVWTMIFFFGYAKSTGYKSKKRQMEWHQYFKSLLPSKGDNRQSEETTHRIRKNLCKPYNVICKEFKQLIVKNQVT